VHPKLKGFYCKNDNEGKRTPKQGAFSKKMGLLVGVSDLFIFYPTEKYHGLWLEIKRNKKYSKSEMSTPSWIAQENFIRLVKSVGYDAHFVYGWIDGKRIIEEYLNG
jgi:hypothetical protein